MGEESIVTIIDRLVDFVKMRKTAQVNEAARALGMSPGHVEKLARLLEDSGLIEVRYSLSGTELVAVEGIKKPEKKKEEKQAARSSVNVSEWIRESQRVFEFLEVDVLKRITATETLLSRIEREGVSEEDRKKIMAELSEVAKSMDSLERELEEVRKKESSFRNRLAEFKKKIEAAGSLQKRKPLFDLNALISSAKALVPAKRAAKEERVKKVLARLQHSGRK